MARRVAITGLGLVTPLGTNVSSTWEGLLAGRSGAGPITRFDPVQSPVKFACEVKGFEPTRFLDKKEVRRYDLFAQFAVGAAEQAVTDACLASNWDKVNLKRVGAIVGTGTGGLQTFEENARALFEKGPSRVSPFFVPMYMPNVAAALISMRYGAKGPNYCTVSACASSAHSVGDALELIRNDAADLMIAGGAEAAITPLAVASFANMKALSERNDEPPLRQGPRRLRDGRRRRRPRPGGVGARTAPRREALCGGRGLRYDRRRLPHHRPRPGRLRRTGCDAARDAGCRREAGTDRLHQRAWHLDAARRRRRDSGGEGGIRRAGAQTGVRLYQVDDRPPARRRRRARGGGVRARRPDRDHSAHHQPVHPGPRLRPRLGCEQGRQAARSEERRVGKACRWRMGRQLFKYSTA